MGYGNTEVFLSPQEREELIRTLSHDIRTPINAIIGFSWYNMYMKMGEG